MLLGFMVAQFVFSLPYNLLVYSIQWVPSRWTCEWRCIWYRHWDCSL